MKSQFTDGRTFLPVTLQAVVEVTLFPAEAAHDVDSSITVGCKAAFRAGVGRYRDFTDQAGLCAGGGSIDNGIINRVIDFNARFLQGIIQVDACVRGTAGTAVVNRRCRSVSEKRNRGRGVNRQSAVLIAEKHAAFFRSGYDMLLQCCTHLLHRAVRRRIVIRVICDGLRRGQGTEEEVYIPFSRVRQRRTKARQAEDHNQKAGQTPPEIGFLHRRLSVYKSQSALLSWKSRCVRRNRYSQSWKSSH